MQKVLTLIRRRVLSLPMSLYGTLGMNGLTGIKICLGFKILLISKPLITYNVFCCNLGRGGFVYSVVIWDGAGSLETNNNKYMYKSKQNKSNNQPNK